MLGSSQSRGAGITYCPPPTLADFCRHELTLISPCVQGSRILDHVAAILKTDRFNSFDRFRETTKTLMDRYEAAGVRSECFGVPTRAFDGSGRWLIHEAVDVVSAVVDVIEPVGFRILDYQQEPFHVVQWSAGTPHGGLVLDLEIIDSPTEIDQFCGDLSNKIVLSRRHVQHIWSRLAERGAQAVIIDQPVNEHPDAIQWQKFGWGGISFGASVPRMVGLALSERQGQRLRDLHRQAGCLRLHVEVDIRRYTGNHDVVSGIILGQDDPQDEVWCLAHSGEPGAADNASGVAVCLEAARVLETLISREELPRPRRSIRFLNAYECFGPFYYLEHQKRLQPPLAGVNLDMVGLQPSRCNDQLHWHESIPMSAQFVNDVGSVIYEAVLNQQKNPTYQLKRSAFRSTPDTLIADPKYGFPCPWLTNCWREVNPQAGEHDKIYVGYHTSIDTLEMLDSDGLATCAAGTAGYLYFLANAGNEELLQLATAETQRILDTMRTPDRRPSESRARYWRDQHSKSMKQLQRWMWGGNRRKILQHLEACQRQVDLETGHSRRVQTVRRQPPGAAAIPRRTALLVPDLDNVTPEIRHALKHLHQRVRPWALYWADGNRSIAEIAELLGCEYEKRVDVEDVITYFDVLSGLGYVELISPSQVVTRADLTGALESLGVERGMDLIVQGSLSRLGHVQGGPDTVIDALLAVIGPEGTLAMSSYNHRKAVVYNPMTTPTTNGAIPDALWRRPDAVRSVHGTHAIAAIGPKAESWCEDHYRAGVWAADGPLGKIVHGGGHLLNLGTKGNLTIHIAEWSVPCRCMDPFGSIDSILMSDGRIHKVRGLAYRSRECPRYEEGRRIIHEGESTRRGKVGSAEATLVKAIDAWTMVRRGLVDLCPSCSIRPRRSS